MKTAFCLLKSFFGVAARGQTYLNALYLLLTLPLGTAYLVFLTTGVLLGLPLSFLVIGLIVLAGVLAGAVGLISFERQMAITLLDQPVNPVFPTRLDGLNLWHKFSAALANPVTWKGLLFLLLKFPLGILSFLLLVTLGATSAVLIGAPLYYTPYPPEIVLVWGMRQAHLVIDTLPEALALCAGGGLLAIASLHVFNGLAWLSGRLARALLGCARRSDPLPGGPPQAG